MKGKLPLSLLFAGMLSACLGQSASPECLSEKTLSITKASKDFVLSKEGGQYTNGPWTFRVDANVLKSDAHLRVEDKSGSSLNIQVPHRFRTKNGSMMTVVNSHPASKTITPIRIVALSPVEYIGSKRIVATLNTTTLPAHTLTVMQSSTKQALPDFSSVPTVSLKSFIVEPQVQSLGTEDYGWLYVLSHDLEGRQQCLKEQTEEIAKEIGDKIGEYVDDPCQACQAIADVVIDVNKCQDLVKNLGPTLCETFLAESAKERWTSTILNSTCKGAIWLGSWVVSYGIELYTGADPAVSICSNTENLKKFLEQYKIRSDCMCDLFIRDPRCKDTSENQDCKAIWNSVVEANLGK